VYLIIFSGGTLMEVIFYTLLAIGLTLLGTFIIRVYIAPEFDKERKRKELHRKRLVNEVINKELQNMNITYNEQQFRVLITGLKELGVKDKYKHTLQHLNAYPSILDSWNKSNTLIKKINEDLHKLVWYTYSKIEREIGEIYKKVLSHPIHHLIREAVKNDFEDLSIKTRNNKKDIDISLGGETWACVKLKGFSKIKIKKFLTSLEKDTEFQKLKNIRKDYKDLNKEFKDNFKSKLRILLDDIKDRKEDLKGKCKECSFWKIKYLIVNKSVSKFF
jgi:hypothetical protein